MHGDISRRTFAAPHTYRAVVAQQGRVVLDADLNEQADLTAHHDEARTIDIVGRVGGALPTSPEDPGPFAIRATDGKVPDGVPWSALVVTPGRYYVDGVLAESFLPEAGIGWPLTYEPDKPGQPHVRALKGISVAGFGVPPETHTRYALYLEVSDHGVTADEEPRLRESALGGPDTSLRRQTTWQVRWAPLGSEVCSDLGATWLARTPRLMSAHEQDAPPDSDPCSITASGGYKRLENQLYRVQIHDGSDAAAGATFLWSRENGSVVAQPVDLGSSTVAGATRIALDREGRDEELDFDVDDLIEVTSTDHQLQRVPGYLATVVAKTGLDIHVTWLAGHPADLGSLGKAPLVRRWEGGPTKLTTTSKPLEDGITVRFPDGGEARTGDYWLIPARSVQLAYGINETRGSLIWPPPGQPPQAAPVGPPSRIAPLGIVERTGSGDAATWKLIHDCRRLFPPLTELITLDVAGGDGQESPPGSWLDEPLRVVVRNGSRPVPGSWVRFTASNAGSLAATPASSGPASRDVQTEADGVAETRWRLKAEGPVTQVVSVQRLDDKEAGIDVAVRFSARLSVSSQVAFSDEKCGAYQGVTTVEGALRKVARQVELRLQGGDGQLLRQGRAVLPHPIRVVADSACGPVQGVPVGALATDGALVREAVDGEPVPAVLTGATNTADGTTRADGAALFWWQPNKGDTDTLELRLPGDDPHHPIVVSAQRERVGSEAHPGHDGAHITEIKFAADGTDFLNADEVTPDRLEHGVEVWFDAELDPANGEYQTKDRLADPVVRVELDIPWPVPQTCDLWAPAPVGTRMIVLNGWWSVEGRSLHWAPQRPASEWISAIGGLWSNLEPNVTLVRGRFIIEGWALLTTDGRAVNTHTTMFFDRWRLRHKLETDNAVAGGTFTQWFTLGRPEIEIHEIPDLRGWSAPRAIEELRSRGIDWYQLIPPVEDHEDAEVIAQWPSASQYLPGRGPVRLWLRIHR